MKSILILIGGYLPGYKVGGPVQTIKNLTDCLGEEYEFYILTADRDLGDNKAYDNIRYDQWNQVGRAKVWYVKPGGFTVAAIRKIAENIGLIYVCGCFNDYARSVMQLKRRGKLKMPVVIAPMGLFSAGALQIKGRKKKLYLMGCKLLAWFKDVVWSVTGEQEELEVKKVIGKDAVCFRAQDIPRHMEKRPEPIRKDNGKLDVIFLSRISPKKNLKYAIDILSQLKGEICFDIYGMPEDEDYYAACMKAVETFPPNVHCVYKGQVRPDEVLETFSRYHVFLFPTRGENYGHVIYEAMAGGCIPVISDRTPWQDLEDRQIGGVVSLEHMKEFVKALQELVDMGQSEYDERRKRVTDYAWEYGEHIDCQGYREIFALGVTAEMQEKL